MTYKNSVDILIMDTIKYTYRQKFNQRTNFDETYYFTETNKKLNNTPNDH